MSVQLGPITISSPAVLAPMAGYSDSAMRRLCRHYGAGMVFSEMLSGEGTRRNNEKTFKMAAFNDEERPLIVQLFASNPEQAAEAVEILQQLEPDGFDLNFGCPMKKIIQSNCGSALLRDVPLLTKIVDATVKVSRVPVSVKIRAGWDLSSLNMVEVAQSAEAAGAAWITIHGRTRSEFFTGTAHWEWIREVKSAVKIPVIGNGDIKNAYHAVDMLKSTGCDAVMIGRGAMAYPFIFREINNLLEHGDPGPAPTPMERYKCARIHLEWMTETYPEDRAVKEFRKHILAYVRGLPNNARFKNTIVRLMTAHEVNECMYQYLSSLPDEPIARPAAHWDPDPVEDEEEEKDLVL